MTIDQAFELLEFGRQRRTVQMDPAANTLEARADGRRAEEAAQIDVTFEFDRDTAQLDAEHRRIGLVGDFLAGAESAEQEFDRVRAGIVAALRRFVDDQAVLANGDVGTEPGREARARAKQACALPGVSRTFAHGADRRCKSSLMTLPNGLSS